jgi:hypothetical protein
MISLIVLLVFMMVYVLSFTGKSNCKPLSLSINSDGVELQTSISHFSDNKVELDLYSMLHVADKSYYDNIEENMKDYDIVLYELITDNSNTVCYDPDKPHRRVLATDLFSIGAENIAREYNFVTQMSMNMKAPHWFIADLDSKTVKDMEFERRKTTLAKYWMSIFAGRASTTRLSMKNFFMSDSLFVTALRLMSWLTPCPELGILIVDWSRFAEAGGLPEIVGPVLNCIFAGNLREARKLAFAQQMMSGLPDAGSWGGEAMSDTTVRVKARNRKCLNILQSFYQEISAKNSDSTKKRIAILYGAYHINDLHNNLEDMGLIKTEPDSKIVAWSMNTRGSLLKSDDLHNDNPLKHVAEILMSRQGVALLFVVPLYLAVGAFDWWALVKLISHGIETIISWEARENDNVSIVASLGFGIVYFGAYIARHVSILRGFSQYGVQWEQPLFSDDMNFETKYRKI